MHLYNVFWSHLSTTTYLTPTCLVFPTLSLSLFNVLHFFVKNNLQSLISAANMYGSIHLPMCNLPLAHAPKWE